MPDSIPNVLEIIRGNLTGLRGKLVRQEGKQKVLVELEKMGYHLQLSIDPNILRRVGRVIPELETDDSF